MLGLADKGAQRRLFASMLKGEPRAMLDGVAEQYALGVEPLALMRSLMELTHAIAVAQVGGSGPEAAATQEHEAVGEWADALGAGQVHRLWQLLLKGFEEVRIAPDPLVAAQMALLRVLHAADMPDPGQLAQAMREMAASGAEQGGVAPATAPADAGRPPDPPPDWRALVERIDQSGAMHLASRLRLQVRVIELAPGRLVYRQEEGFGEDLAPELRAALLSVTDRRWTVEAGEGEGVGAPTLAAQDESAKEAQAAEVRGHDLVQAAFAAFPDAEIVEEEHSARGQSPWNKQR